VSISTTNGLERINEDFKYQYLARKNKLPKQHAWRPGGGFLSRPIPRVSVLNLLMYTTPVSNSKTFNLQFLLTPCGWENEMCLLVWHINVEVRYINDCIDK